MLLSLFGRIPEIVFPDTDLKFPEITDFFDINNMQVQELMDYLKDMNLPDQIDQLMRIVEELHDKLQEQVHNNAWICLLEHPWK